MPANSSLRALREANPRKQPGFDQSIEHYEALRTQIAATPVSAPRRLPQLSGRRRLIGLSAAGGAIAAAAALAGLLLTATSPPSAYAAAKDAIAATTATALDSGTMTLEMIHDSSVSELDTTRWNDKNISVSLGVGSGDEHELLLVGGETYVLQHPGDRWMRFKIDSVMAPQLGSELADVRADVAGAHIREILAATADLEKTAQPDGSTIYRGTVEPSNTDAAISPGDVDTADDAIRVIMRLRSGDEVIAPGGQQRDIRVELLVGGDGLLRRVSVTFETEDAKYTAYNGTWNWSVEYSQLGSTPAITAPDASRVVEAQPPPITETTSTVTTPAATESR